MEYVQARPHFPYETQAKVVAAQGPEKRQPEQLSEEPTKVPLSPRSGADGRDKASVAARLPSRLSLKAEQKLVRSLADALKARRKVRSPLPSLATCPG